MGIDRVVKECRAQGVQIAWFGRSHWEGFTSTSRHWKYVDAQNDHPTDRQHDHLKLTQELLRTLCDIPLYHTSSWNDNDFEVIGQIIASVVSRIAKDSLQ